MKKRRIVITVVVVIFVIAGIISVIDVNKRFPARTKEVYSLGEWMPAYNGVCVNAVEAYILDGEELKECMHNEFNGNWDFMFDMKTKKRALIIRLKIRNDGDTDRKVLNNVLQLAVCSYPAGWSSGVLHYVEKDELAPGDECEGMIAALISDAAVKDKEYPKFVKNNTFQVVQAVYPVYRMIEFKIEEE